jgi:RND family efflux transporter MFP subunit
MFFVLLIGGSLAAACGRGDTPAAGAAGAGGRAGGMPPMPVEMVTLAEAPVEQAGEFVGSVKSRRSTTVQPQVEGIITRILVKSGDRVTPGKPMVEIDAAVQRAAAASLASVRAAREAEATFARQQAQRAKTLLDAGAMSQQEYEQAVAQQRAADAQLKAVDEQMRQQQAELAYYTVTASTTGIIGDVPVHEGDRVTRATVLTTIEENAGLEVYISIPVQQAASLRNGLPVRLVDESGATVATTSINYVANVVDDTTQTVLAKAPIDARGGHFRTDQFVRARVIWSTTPGLTIPVTAVTRINGQYFAYVAEGAEGGLIAHLRQVTLGPVVDNNYIVLTGLKAGEKLITSGLQKIGDGAPVQAAPPRGGGPGAGAGGR